MEFCFSIQPNLRMMIDRRRFSDVSIEKSRAKLSPTTVKPIELEHLFQSIFLRMFYPENVLHQLQNEEELYPAEIR